ncbi:major facilitator superfamily domain-containing protein [Suillus subluteus]|nr:major facilitator superfamily domain-containing protein [Suillus subluteus]
MLYIIYSNTYSVATLYLTICLQMACLIIPSSHFFLPAALIQIIQVIHDAPDTSEYNLLDLSGMSFSGDNIPDKFKQLEDEWQQGPANPRNWSPARKWTTTAIVVFYTFVTPLASSIMTPGLPGLAIKFGITDPTVTALTLSIFLLSFAIGPLFAAPLSEVYGRVWVLHLGNLFFLGFNLGCAFSPNTTSFLLFRFLAGLAGGALHKMEERVSQRCAFPL